MLHSVFSIFQIIDAHCKRYAQCIGIFHSDGSFQPGYIRCQADVIIRGRKHGFQLFQNLRVFSTEADMGLLPVSQLVARYRPSHCIKADFLPSLRCPAHNCLRKRSQVAGSILLQPLSDGENRNSLRYDRNDILLKPFHAKAAYPTENQVCILHCLLQLIQVVCLHPLRQGAFQCRMITVSADGLYILSVMDSHKPNLMPVISCRKAHSRSHHACSNNCYNAHRVFSSRCASAARSDFFYSLPFYTKSVKTEQNRKRSLAFFPFTD